MDLNPKLPSDADFCLCDHEKENNLPPSKTCIFVCPTKAKQLFEPFLKRLRDKKKNDK